AHPRPDGRRDAARLGAEDGPARGRGRGAGDLLGGRGDCRADRRGSRHLSRVESSGATGVRDARPRALQPAARAGRAAEPGRHQGGRLRRPQGVCMTHVRRRPIAPWLVLVLGLLLAAPADARAFELFRSEEATIADIQAALKARTLTCRALVQMYLDRIEAYDTKGPALNAIVTINADALKTADALDVKYAQSGPTGPLHCVPIIV